MNKKPLRRAFAGPLMYLLMFVVILLVVQTLSSGSPVEPKTLSYTTLLEWIEADLGNNIGETLTDNQADMTIDRIIIQQTKLIGRTENSVLADSQFGTYYDFECIIPSEEQFYTDVNAIYKSVLGRDVRPTEYCFEVTSKLPEETPWWIEWVPLLLTMVLFGGFWFIMMRQQSGGNKGMANFGKARAKVANPNDKKVTFADVAGAKEEKEELSEVVEFLKDPKKFTRLGAKIPAGMLLVGPPGTGKTLLARAVAGEAGVPFFTISGSDFVEMFVGVGASRVRDLFDKAKSAAPSIIFIDEIDAVGRQRGTGLGGGHDEREQTLNQLLVEMDGFTQNQGVIVMAATNRADILDPALLRPGRFDRQITVGYPDVDGRAEILKVHSRNKPLAEDVDLRVLARRTPYFTGADLMNVMNEAALLAARRNLEKIDMPIIEEAITRVMAGPEKKSRRVTDADRKLVAYHEGGHAIVSYYIPECDKVHEITTIPRGNAGGYTMYLPQEEFSFITTARLRADMASSMGGRVAEAIVFGDISTGASSDIKHATNIARSMVTEYGMSEKLGPVFLGGEREVFIGKSFAQQGSNLSERMSADVDNEVQALVQGAYDRAEQILTEHRDQLDALADLLIEREKLDAEEFECFMSGKPLPEKSSPVQAETPAAEDASEKNETI